VAALAAKVAEKAAEAALLAPDRSGTAAHEAFHFAVDAINAARDHELLERLQQDFEALRRVVKRGRWSDESRVPSSVFDLLGLQEPKSRPWWKLW
jgi:hypothetical protein